MKLAGECPHCKEERLIPIAYGFPSEDTVACWRDGALELGGCVITGDDASFHCMACHYNVWWDGRTKQPDPSHLEDHSLT